MGGLQHFLRRVRRRYLWNVLVEQIAHAASIAMGGLILLLIFGTQVLDWFWLALLAVGSLGAFLYRSRRRIPSIYRVAQIIDRRLHLRDSISTAYYYAKVNPERAAAESVREAQLREAMQFAREADVRSAVPLTMPRALYATGILAMVAFGMLGVRYGMRRSLDLRPPISQVLVDLFRAPNKLLAAEKKDDDRRKMEEFFKENGIWFDQQDSNRVLDEKAPNSPITSPDMSGASEAAAADRSSKTKDQAGSEQRSEQSEGDEQAEGAPNAEGTSASDENSPDSQSGPSQSKQGQQQQQNAQKQNNQPTNENSSLMDKMRDAMANRCRR